MEERYIDMQRRRSGGRRAAPPRRQAPRRAPHPPRRRSAGRRLFWGLYTCLAVVSAVIVAVYLGARFLIRLPAQAPVPPPSQNTVLPSDTPAGTGDGSVPVEDPNKPEPLVRREQVYTVLLAATDVEGYRTDTMMVMTYDVPNQKVGVVSIPRDTLVARSSENPKLVYGKGGVEQRVEDISQMLGIPIDYYIKVNIKGFIRLVDNLGGIDFYVPCNMNYDDPAQNLSIHYTQGQYHLSGQQAMEVARFRKNNDGSGYTDVGRTQTQQKLLIALAKKVLSWSSLTKINSFVETFNKNVSTDLSLNDMLYFASQAVNVDLSSGVETATLEGRGDAVYRKYTYCYELDPEKTVETVNRLLNPYIREMSLDDMNIAKAQGYR